ncbi:universal stress protein [Trinickia dinghuensis]|uniref:Universal stress protein n=1 Tax=Trinickia dinghuensis TaxID=2291023 RepID=A0A3D8K1T7_9BURK|nr:universal stress protein [Trinickia dinghuensis]RDU99427.1 universal stress protein [Trinickia dinghuensis]
MSYKSILVHLDTSEGVHSRLELAQTLAKQFDAYLTGFFTVYRPEPGSFYVLAGNPEYYVEFEHRRLEQQGALERLFRAEILRLKVAGEWQWSTEYANRCVPKAARLADLAIVGQYNPEDPESFVAEQFIENLVLSSGRPVLVVPYAGKFPTIASHVLIAWDGSREATRALHDALPFLGRAKKVTVLTVNAMSGEPPSSRIPGSDIAAIVARYGANVTTQEIEGVKDVPIGETILSRAADLDADLLVMGCYGHSRWRELVLGGATRSILKSMTVPVLMSH